MAEKAMTNEQNRIAMTEKLWLNYFNQTLYEKGYITETQRNRLKNMIESRKPSANIK